MSKIERAMATKAANEATIRDLRKSMGKNVSGEIDPYNDKYELKLNNLSSKNLEMGYGYYGSSSYYRCYSENASRVLRAAINKKMWSLAECAIQLLKNEIDQALKEAREEAEEVLKSSSTL